MLDVVFDWFREQYSPADVDVMYLLNHCPDKGFYPRRGWQVVDPKEPLFLTRAVFDAVGEEEEPCDPESSDQAQDDYPWLRRLHEAWGI